MTTRERSVSAWAAEHGATLAACLGAVVWFFAAGYGPTLAPTHTAWMMRSDWAAYHWGFSFFRNADWAFPLGNTPELFYPHGTSVAFTDANPWASVLFKLLSPLLPLDFQFSGLWFLLCFVLQATFGVQIARAFSTDRVQHALGGLLFALTPLLPSRAAHIALSAFFFVTFGVALHIRPVVTREQAIRLLAGALAMLVWAAGTHGYLSVMLLALVLAFIVRLATSDRLLSPREGALAALACLALTIATYWLFGWRATDLTAEGFGDFSGDLSALVNPQEWSRFFAKLPYRPRQWEGFLYLGTGVFFLLLCGLPLLARVTRPALTAALRRSWALVLVVFLLWVYSLSSRVSLLGETVLDLEGFYEPFSSLTGIFRSSGRFAWPLHLSLIALGVAVAGWMPRAWLGRTLLGVALVLQAAELDTERLDFSDVQLAPLTDPAWASAGESYEHLRLVPLHLLWVCQYDHRLVNRLSQEAYHQKLTFNSGNFMRKQAGVKALCKQHVGPGEAIDAETIYVLGRGYLGDFHGRDVSCGLIDDLTVCVANARDSSLRRALTRRPLVP